jgi:hypothetical protein
MKNIKNRINNTLIYYIDMIKIKFLKLLILISLLLINYPPRLRADVHQLPVIRAIRVNQDYSLEQVDMIDLAEQVDPEACQLYFNYYGININTRSYNGWARVIKNRNLPAYITLNNNDNRYLNQTYECLLNIPNSSRQKNFSNKSKNEN